MLLRVSGMPTMIMEIDSGSDGADGFKMMLEAAALVRTVQCMLPGTNFVVVAIYIDKNLVAT